MGSAKDDDDGPTGPQTAERRRNSEWTRNPAVLVGTLRAEIPSR